MWFNLHIHWIVGKEDLDFYGFVFAQPGSKLVPLLALHYYHYNNNLESLLLSIIIIIVLLLVLKVIS